MERKKSFWSFLGILIVRITAVFVAILVILVVSINIAGNWKVIAWILGIILFFVWLACRCFQRGK